MERAVGGLIRMAFTIALATGGGVALRHLVLQAQRDAKGAMSMGISYGKFNRALLRGGARGSMGLSFSPSYNGDYADTNADKATGVRAPMNSPHRNE